MNKKSLINYIYLCILLLIYVIMIFFMTLSIKDIFFMLLFNVDSIPIMFETTVVPVGPADNLKERYNDQLVIAVMYFSKYNEQIMLDLDNWVFMNNLERCWVYSGKTFEGEDILMSCEWCDAYIIRDGEKIEFKVWIINGDFEFWKSKDLWPIIEHVDQLYFYLDTSKIKFGRGFYMDSYTDSHIRSTGSGIKYFNALDKRKWQKYFITTMSSRESWKIVSFKR